MKNLIVKQWRDGKFEECARHELQNVQQIQIMTNRVNIVLNGFIRTYGDDCIIEFE